MNFQNEENYFIKTVYCIAPASIVIMNRLQLLKPAINLFIFKWLKPVTHIAWCTVPQSVNTMKIPQEKRGKFQDKPLFSRTTRTMHGFRDQP